MTWAEVYYKLGRIYDIRTAAGVEPEFISQGKNIRCPGVEAAEKRRVRMGNVISFA